jgi:hypothetical protein
MSSRGFMGREGYEAAECPAAIDHSHRSCLCFASANAASGASMPPLAHLIRSR